MSSSAFSWYDANMYCQSIGSHLATLLSENEFVFTSLLIEQKFFYVTKFWIGGNDESAEGVWTWSNGDPWSFSGFTPNEPNGGFWENCLELRNINSQLYWNDVGCNTVQHALCQKM